MSLAPKRGILTLIWILVLVFGVVLKTVSAQEGNQVRLAPVDTQSFPIIRSYLDVRSSTGGFVYGLDQQQVHIVENGRRLPVQELQQLRTGAQFVLAISPGPAFEIRDIQGISRYEYLADALQDWAVARQGSTVDDLSLIVSEGPESTHSTDLDRWAATLRSFSPTGEETGPDFDVLTRALDIASDPTSDPGMSAAILFITPLPGQEVSLGLQSLAARATQQGVKIYIWLVASSEQFSSPEAEQMRLLAEQTGGTLFNYSGQEIIPSPEDFLDELRNTYALSYNSSITTSGVHQISAEINYQSQLLTSPAQEIELEVFPPSITFISPPIEVERSLSDPQDDSSSLVPTMQPLDLLIEFPDGHLRPINQTTLYVDGLLIGVNEVEPYDRFNWVIDEITSSGEHILVAEVEDSLGLIGKSVETVIFINVVSSEESILDVVSQNRLILVIVMAAVVGAILLLVLILGGRLQPGFIREWRRKRKRNGAITQPVKNLQDEDTQSRSSWINRIQWRRGPVTIKPNAQFIPLADSNSEESHPPLAITKRQTIFGRDDNIVDLVLTDPSVENVHAKIVQVENGVYRLSDQGSIAGTWVNYLPIPENGQILEHGDLVHFGRMGFRFVLRNPKRVRKPVLRIEETK